MTRIQIQVILELNYFYSDDAEAIATFMHTPLRQFKGKTPNMLVKAGRGPELIGYIQAAILAHKEDAEGSEQLQLVAEVTEEVKDE